MNRSLTRLRCLLVWTTTTGLAGALAGPLVADLVAADHPGAAAGASLTTLCEVTLLGCLAWAWLATTAVVVEALLVRSPAAAPATLPGVPARWRAVVLLACGAALAAGVAVPAQATPGAVQVAASGQVDADADPLRGLPYPERATDRRTVPPPAAAPAAPATEIAGQESVVRRGDTLWAIARAELGEGGRWGEIYALNRAVLGADPDLIVPGQRLALPAVHPLDHPS